jgi:hypothetical protein
MLCMETPVCLWTTSVGLGDDRRGIRTEAMSERDTGIDELKEGEEPSCRGSECGKRVQFGAGLWLRTTASPTRHCIDPSPYFMPLHASFMTDDVLLFFLISRHPPVPIHHAHHARSPPILPQASVLKTQA